MAKMKRRELEILKNTAAAQDDKRVFCRFALDKVPVRFKDLKVGVKSSAVCRDIGGGGAGIECREEIKAKTPLELWFELPDGFEPMHLLGKVAWSNLHGSSCRIGVAFDKARMMSLARIMRVLL